MRREYTLTSPEPLYPQRPPPRSPQPQPHFHPASSFQSPSHQQEDPLNQKYPTSFKYNPLRQVSKSPPVQRPTYMSPIEQTPYNSHTGDSSQAIQISQLRLTVSQLRNSLQTCSQNSQRLQEELFLEKSKNVELNEVRRRMEEELARMEFQLDRIGNYDALESRQATIKLENAQRENSRLSQQVSDLLEELKTIKHDQRALMTQCDTLLKDKQALMRENEGLMEQLQALRGLEREMREVKHEVAMHSQENLHSEHNIPSRINNLHTVRTYQTSTINNSPRPHPSTHLPVPNIKTKTSPSIHLQDLSESAEYQREDELQKQILKLQEENKSLKQLYNNFYSTEDKHQDPQPAHMQTFSNKLIVQQLDSSRLHHHADDSPTVMLKTMQKRQLSEEVAAVRDAAIGQLVKVFNNTVEKAETQRNNSFKVFLHHLLKNKLTYLQMAENYLEVRTAIQEQTGLKFPQNLDERQVTDERERKILQIYQSVKEKSRNKKELEKQNGISLAIFRLLALLIKASPISANLSDNIKHSLLKYVYKLGNKQRLNSQQ